MAFFIEAILWWLILIDSLIYNIFCYMPKKKTHWLSKIFPVNKWFGTWYVILVLWVGFALYRLDILFNVF